MRSPDQIKRKLNELKQQRHYVDSRLTESDDNDARKQLQLQADRLDDMLMLLEWVLNEPTGSYHSS